MLLNIDFKILTKMLATRPTKVLPLLVNVDQTGFMPNKTTDLSLQRVFTHTELHFEHPDNHALVFLDLSKSISFSGLGVYG